VPVVARWRGFGRSTNFKRHLFRDLYLGRRRLAQATERIMVSATSRVLRFTRSRGENGDDQRLHQRRPLRSLNIVNGLVQPRDGDVRRTQREHDERYAYEQEWLDFVQRLRRELRSFDVDKMFYL
jgi:dimethylsulfone monooxygenase